MKMSGALGLPMRNQDMIAVRVFAARPPAVIAQGRPTLWRTRRPHGSVERKKNVELYITY